jgi:hypothetical protein
MKKILFTIFAIFNLAVALFAQKGVDTQTQQIKQDGNKTTNTNSNDSGSSGRSFDWGKDKTKVRPRLANPYKLTSRRDVLIATILDVLKEKKIIVDESSSRIKDGVIVTQPFVFAKGAVITQNELNRYAILENTDRVWRGGRYTLRIDVESIDGIQNNVSVTAKIEGKSENGLVTEWANLQSSGEAEEEFMIKLVESVTGNLIDEPKITNF